MPSASPHILLIGGHGKIAQFLTPLFLARSWNVTSLIRTPDQKATIEKLGQGQPGKLNVKISSLDDIQSEQDAKKVLDDIEAGLALDWVVWSAGAGGRGGASRTIAIDQTAAIAFTKASISTPSIRKFLTVSYNGSRRGRASWWSDSDYASMQKVNTEILPTYYKAKIAADEVLTVLAKKRYEDEVANGTPEKDRFCGIDLRPGTLRDGAKGGIALGKIGTQGKVSREVVAEVAVALLEREGARGWFDLLDGEEEVGSAVERVVGGGVDCVEGEDFGDMEGRVAEL
ncbi:hypothetical protein P154DRAFT_549484 [Amniculicola lignicola CBS 123094]|uniref:NAD(P)-binding domain-containing protein n=1 Tax=Amniculicola lignicola CBS 123094 TaxID=1392246 RepID=A0A6A5VVN9_9PLEO|nr:hypothetical protein P154DRAFT_549484 [Amniculicola lignicola CBS 123094]